MARPVVENWAVSDSGGSTVSSLSLTPPSGIVAGELLLAFVASDDSSDTTQFSTSTTGWTKLVENINGGTSDCHVGVFWKEAVGSDAAVVIDAASSDEMLGWYVRVSGANTTTPFDTYRTYSSTNGTTTRTFHVVESTDDAESIGLAIMSFDGGDITLSNYTSTDATLTQIDEHNSGTSGNDTMATLVGFYDLGIGDGTWGSVDLDPTDGSAMAAVAIYPGSASRAVTTIPEVIAVVENPATVVKSVPRVVGCVSEAIAVTENDASVLIGVPRVVTGISEAIRVVPTESSGDVSYVGINRTSSENTGSITLYVDKPASTQQGDLIVIEGVARNSYLGEPEAGGWTLGFEYSIESFQVTEPGTTNDKKYMWWKIAGASEPTNYDLAVTDDGTDGQIITCSSWRNATNITVYDAVSSSAAPSVNASTGDMLISIHSTASDNTNPSPTAPSGMTRIDVLSMPSSDVGSAIAYELIASGGATGTRTWGDPFTTFEIAVNFVIETAGGGGGGTSVNRGRGVAGISEAIAVIENDATVEAIAPRDVTTVPEAIAVIENDAAVNSSRNVTQESYTPAITDSFTDTDDVLISAHTPDLGPSWVRHGSGSGEAKISGNQLVGNHTSFDEWVIESGEADCTLTCLAHVGSPYLTSNVAIIFRSATTANSSNHYHFALTAAGASLIRVSTASGTQNWGTNNYLGSNLDTTRSLRIVMNGSNIKCYVDNVLHFNVNDSVHASETLHGFRFFGADGNWIDNFSVVTGDEARIGVARMTTNINREEIVACIPELIAVTENDATIETGVNLEVAGITEVIAVIENDAIVNTNVFRNFTTIPEVVAVVEIDSTISYNIPRVVNGIPESIAVIENDATVISGVNLGVTTIPEVIAVVEMDSTISYNIPLIVSAIPEVILVTENDATISYNLPRVVSGIPESISVIENDATISYNIPRVVSAIPESIAVIENISQIFRGSNLVVSCTPESIAVIESPASITKSRGVLTISEVIALTENPSTIALDRVVTGLPESIQVIELLSTVIRGVASTRRVMIVS